MRKIAIFCLWAKKGITLFTKLVWDQKNSTILGNMLVCTLLKKLWIIILFHFKSENTSGLILFDTNSNHIVIIHICVGKQFKDICFLPNQSKGESHVLQLTRDSVESVIYTLPKRSEISMRNNIKNTSSQVISKIKCIFL